MALFDAHCDMLFKLWEDPTINVYEDERLHVSISKLKQMEKPIQCFAIFVPESVPFVHKLDAAQQQINIFYQKVLNEFNDVKLIKTKSDIDDLKQGEIGAVLTLEGCDAVGDRLENLELLYELGIRSVGLTWNYANLVADGAQETRNAGITNFGKDVITFLNKKRLWTDLSHTSERSFWEGLDLAEYPIASHSNTHHLCTHVRNLKDEQIVALFRKNGMMGITFVPFFTTNYEQPTIKDLLKHIDHLCSLGGENHIGFGSDFDGIDQTIVGLENYLCYEPFINELQRNYPESLVEKFIYQNFINHISY
ncbi:MULTISPECIES: dipeptidase [Bacillaceae]|uniref:dipeptidase n=1 Tax=Bacillaceae TaxID=186817 RepID=UPI000BFD93F8|nr:MULTISPECIES: dipeptidase [Bacillaceae]PGT86744.1 diguanylate cyclase [Bacillus sp. AFS040349]UGB32746.1 dipeptidase [Metabacillus sp. B2-18]